jgi:hypothetical protein
MKITYEASPHVEESLERLHKLTGCCLSELIGSMICRTLGKIFSGDTDLLQSFLQPLQFRTEEEAVACISRYNAFIAELAAKGTTQYLVDAVYHDLAAPVRDKETGQWEILFKDTNRWNLGYEQGDKRRR